MTQDKEPIRSRRQLRAETEVRAESAAADAPAVGSTADAPVNAPAPASGAPVSADAPATARARRAANSPVDAPAPGVATERSSQTRARDRAALRAYRELSTPRAGAAPALPSRKDLRRAQRAAEGRTADTAMTAVVPVAQPQGSPTAAAGEAARPTAAVPAAPSSPGTPASGASGASTAATAAGTAAASSDNQNPNPSPDPDQMSVAEALAARQALLQDVHDHAAGLELPEGADPLAVDLTILAQQRELAERAAVLNARAAARERIAAENASKKSESIDPTATHNLAMVTPLEFMNIPGSDRPVLRPPVTSHVPVVTRNNPAARVRTPPPLPPQTPAKTSSSATNDAGEQAIAATSPQTRAGRHGTSQAVDAPSSLAGTARSPRTSHARTLRRAEEAFQAGREPAGQSATRRNAKPKNSAISQDASAREVAASESQEASPISAGAAHGLEPLDALTAGLGRANRARNLVWGSVAAGALALIVGIIMIIIGLSH